MTMQELEIKYEQAKIFEQELSEKANEARIALKEKFQTVLKQFFVEDDCIICCANVSISYRDVHKAEFRCDIGFKDPKNPDRMEFGSSFWFQFEDGKIQINAGTIGSYKLSDIYQLKRNNTIYHLTCISGDKLEQALNEIDCSEYLEAAHKEWKAASETRDAYKDIENAKVKAISESLSIGKVYKYSDKASGRNNIFKKCSHFAYKNDLIKITKITNKFVEVEITNLEKDLFNITISDKVRKEKFIDEIMTGRIVEVE